MSYTFFVLCGFEQPLAHLTTLHAKHDTPCLTHYHIMKRGSICVQVRTPTWATTA
uniref:Long chain acyl-CoA synthetase 6 peroxisomal-like n=1 Tax=Rhizophora mucronata TaxID=61149 RepID=A0A2P2JSI3_RHIMU